MRRVSGLFLCLILGQVAVAQRQSNWVHSDFATGQIEAYRKHFDVPGLSIAVAIKGEVVFAKGFGFADVERNVPVRPTDYFRLASVSKPITATLIFELVEQGKLDIDAQVRQFLPQLPGHHVYRIRDLLSHQSGVRHYAKEPALKNYPNSMAALDRFVKDPLLFAPGEKFSYSTHAFTVLGAVIEKVTKTPYRTYSLDRLRAWGITGVQCETGANSNRTRIYDQVQNKNRVANRDDLSWKFPGGGFESTAIGLCRLGLAIRGAKILKKDTLSTMWTVQKPRTGDSTMALGWTISNAGGHRAAVHGGSQLGSNSNWRVQIDEDTVIVVLSNRDGHRPGDLATYLGRLSYLGPNDKLPPIELKTSP
ncbi:MAG: beta-lactamase family protein [Chlorobia bacterium]|nr:beta-lactamase family protein [Fimbriimonadaceae bacterium]